MPSAKHSKTKKHNKKSADQKHSHKTRNHSNLRPRQHHSKSFLKVYYPYLPLVAILIVIIALVAPWSSISGSTPNNVLPYATQLSLKELARTTNQHRRSNGQKPLELNSELSRAAQNKAKNMVTKNYWSHTSPSGTEPWEFINKTGYSYKKAGENLAYGFNDSKSVLAGWMNSSSHRDNVLDPAYEDVGFGFANSPDFVGEGATTIVVAMYGDPAKTAVKPANQSFSPSLAQSTLPTPKNVSRIQAWTNGSLPWATAALGLVIGIMTTYLILKHTRELKKAFKQGEQYILKHPLVDLTVTAFIILGILLVQKVGVVL